jgi:hypothetical protein
MVTKLTSIFVQEIPTQPKEVTLDELQEAIDILIRRNHESAGIFQIRNTA